MRAVATLVALVLTVPTLAAVALPTPAADAPLDFALLPDDLPDGTLLRLLAFESGVVLPRESLAVTVPPSETLSSVLHRIAARLGESLADEDVAEFLTLDPAVTAPTLALMLALEQAWDLRDHAMRDIDDGELAELGAYFHDVDRRPFPTERERAVMAQVDREAMFRAALILLDTLDTLVIPQLQFAADNAPWPATPIEDPIGILRINTRGNDFDAKTRIVQIDPAGDDLWKNPAGASTILQDVDTRTPDYPIGISLDFNGNDKYDYHPLPLAQGAGLLGVGIMMDTRGHDDYRCDNDCQGAGSIGGVGYHRDFEGDDEYDSFQFGAGAAAGLGIHRNDAGDDTYDVEDGGGGASTLDSGTGLLWDRDGTDRYLAPTTANYGFSYYTGGRGWLVDEGENEDHYSTASLPFGRPHGCNNCRWGPIGYSDVPPWSIGPVNGRGNDNAGGLAALLSEDGSLFYLGPYHVP